MGNNGIFRFRTVRKSWLVSVPTHTHTHTNIITYFLIIQLQFFSFTFGMEGVGEQFWYEFPWKFFLVHSIRLFFGYVCCLFMLITISHLWFHLYDYMRAPCFFFRLAERKFTLHLFQIYILEKCLYAWDVPLVKTKSCCCYWYNSAFISISFDSPFCIFTFGFFFFFFFHFALSSDKNALSIFVIRFVHTHLCVCLHLHLIFLCFFLSVRIFSMVRVWFFEWTAAVCSLFNNINNIKFNPKIIDSFHIM